MGAWVLLGQRKAKCRVTSPLMYIYCFVLRVDTSKSGLMDVSLLAHIWDSMASSSATLHHPLWSLRRLQWWQEFPEWILEEAATFRLWISARKILNRRSAVGKWLSCVTEIQESRFWWLNQSVNPFHIFWSHISVNTRSFLLVETGSILWRYLKLGTLRKYPMLGCQHAMVLCFNVAMTVQMLGSDDKMFHEIIGVEAHANISVKNVKDPCEAQEDCMKVYHGCGDGFVQCRLDAPWQLAGSCTNFRSRIWSCRFWVLAEALRHAINHVPQPKQGDFCWHFAWHWPCFDADDSNSLEVLDEWSQERWIARNSTEPSVYIASWCQFLWYFIYTSKDGIVPWHVCSLV